MERKMVTKFCTIAVTDAMEAGDEYACIHQVSDVILVPREDLPGFIHILTEMLVGGWREEG